MNARLFIFFAFYDALIHVSETAKEIELSAVTRFHGLPEFYEMIKLQGRSRALNIDVKTKFDICSAIFVNPFFEMVNERYFVVTNEANRKKLKKKRPDIFDELYEESASPSCFLPSNRTEYTLVNPDTVRVVVVGARVVGESRNRYDETVFVCLSRMNLSDTIKKYFVSSSDYNMNRAINVNGINDYIAGRFVFKADDQRENELSVYALAEETGQMFVKGAGNVEKFYVRKRRNREPSENAGNDPVCALTVDEKLRLCAIVMSSPDLIFEGYEFVPQDVFLERECARREISFKTQKGLQASSDKEYKEWMIGCQVKNNYNSYEPFYVSRGYAANCVFVYKPVFGFIYLHHFDDNVSVLRD